MKIKRFKAETSRKALHMVRDEFGDEAMIISNTQLADGSVEVVAALDLTEALSQSEEIDTRDAQELHHSASSPRTVSNWRASAPRQASASRSQQSQLPPGQPSRNPSFDFADQMRNFSKQSTTAAQGSAAHNQPRNHSANAIDTMRDEIDRLRELMEQQSQQPGYLHASHEPASTHLTRLYIEMGLNPALANQLVNEQPDLDNVPQQQAISNGLTHLAERIQVTHDDILQHGGVVVLIGPAGAGKTATIAKLARHFAINHNPNDIILVSTDRQRIGAHEQLLAFGRLLGIPVLKARNKSEVREIIIATDNKKLVLIDTGSLTRQQLQNPQEIVTFQTGRAQLKHYLVIPATNQATNINRSLAAFHHHKLAGCIITKTDDATEMGSALSASIQYEVPIAYWTDGQKTTADFHTATAHNLLQQTVELTQNIELQNTLNTLSVSAQQKENDKLHEIEASLSKNKINPDMTASKTDHTNIDSADLPPTAHQGSADKNEQLHQ